jgi:hypothetical protein
MATGMNSPTGGETSGMVGGSGDVMGVVLRSWVTDGGCLAYFGLRGRDEGDLGVGAAERGLVAVVVGLHVRDIVLLKVRLVDMEGVVIAVVSTLDVASWKPFASRFVVVN